MPAVTGTPAGGTAEVEFGGTEFIGAGETVVAGGTVADVGTVAAGEPAPALTVGLVGVAD